MGGEPAGGRLMGLEERPRSKVTRNRRTEDRYMEEKCHKKEKGPGKKDTNNSTGIFMGKTWGEEGKRGMKP